MKAKPRLWCDDYEYDPPRPDHRSIVIEEEARDDWTGLLNARGEPIYRERQPFGFRRS